MRALTLHAGLKFIDSKKPAKCSHTLLADYTCFCNYRYFFYIRKPIGLLND